MTAYGIRSSPDGPTHLRAYGLGPDRCRTGELGLIGGEW
jgi:hypothetical protein